MEVVGKRWRDSNRRRQAGAILDMWDALALTCAVFGLGFTDLKDIYVAKNRINFERQRQNYNEDTKTEADNLSIPA